MLSAIAGVLMAVMWLPESGARHDCKIGVCSSEGPVTPDSLLLDISGLPAGRYSILVRSGEKADSAQITVVGE